MRLRRSLVPSSRRTKTIDRSSAAIVSSRSLAPPMTLTQTFAWRRSGVVSTSVTVAKPIRGSATSRSSDRPDLLAEELVEAVGPLAHRSRPAPSRIRRWPPGSRSGS